MGFEAFTRLIQTAEELDLIRSNAAQNKRHMIRQGTNILKENQKNRLDFKPES